MDIFILVDPYHRGIMLILATSRCKFNGNGKFPGLWIIGNDIWKGRLSLFRVADGGRKAVVYCPLCRIPGLWGFVIFDFSNRRRDILLPTNFS